MDSEGERCEMIMTAGMIYRMNESVQKESLENERGHEYCVNCGSPVPHGQRSICSMCYGDINYGSDGYYQQWTDNIRDD